MSLKCKDLVDDYIAWLRTKITIAEVNGACQITTPFLDRHNDHIQIFVTQAENGLRLTDDGYILGDLQSSGCSIDTPHRRKVLQVILNGFGIHEEHGELFTHTSIATFPQRKHALVQAMLSVNDMFMTAKQRVETLFLEDVSHFLDEHEIRYSPSVEFTGKTGFIHKFDFVIPKSRTSPERLVRAINNPKRETTTSVLFSWTDTRDVRSPDSQFYVVLNDADKQVSSDLLSAFSEYEVKVIPWSKRSLYIPALVS